MPTVVGGGSSQSPGLQTFSTLKTRVSRYVNSPDSSEALTVAGQEINDAIRELNTRTWYWSLSYEDITLTASTADYNLSSNFNAARNLQLLNSSGEPCGTIGYYDPKTFDLQFSSSSGSGSPCAYTVYSFLDTYQLSFDIPCSSAFVASYPTARLRYLARVPTLTNDSDTVPVPSEVELFIMWKARAGMALQYDEKKYGMAEGKAQQLWGALVRKDNEHHFHDWA